MTDLQPPIAILFDTFGPYHLARLHAARQEVAVVGIEIGSRSDDYPWFDSQGNDGALKRLFPGKTSSVISTGALRHALFAVLDEVAPRTVAVPGWGTYAALVALEWCARNNRPAIMMCDSTATDAPRRAGLEAIKRGVVSSCAAGFASGSRSTDYLGALGLPRDRIFRGYDVVDNKHFARGVGSAPAVEASVRAKFGLPDTFILSLGRLIDKKNLKGLLEGYAAYRARAGAEAASLVIAGSGPLDAILRARAAELDVSSHVTFAGHISYDDLPTFYAMARSFVLVSTVEQWGLVINEAIACGLPILVSDRCGASADLVEQGCNGVLCAPDPSAIAEGLFDLMHRSDLAAFGRHSMEIAERWDLSVFVAGLRNADRTARAVGRPPRLLPILVAMLFVRLGALRRRHA